jgi:predicted DNA-binding WGR domain protein
LFSAVRRSPCEDSVITERELFEAELDQEPGDRAGFLDRACAGAPEKRERLEALLARQEKVGSFLERPVVEETHIRTDRPNGARASDETVGQVLAGRYKLLEQIGEGGMGTVWLALQTKPVRRRVAVKFIKAGMDSRTVLSRLEALGAEGLMLRRPESRYESGRSQILQKVKSFHDSGARVVAHQEGSGRHKGRLGALLVEMSNGTQFAVGTGRTDAERENPPAPGSLITFRYQELSDRGVPRFPSYAGVRAEAGPPLPLLMKGQHITTTSVTPCTRRFEFSQGNSNKFWVILLQGTDVFVRFGRIGTSGQTNEKSFSSEAEAAKHVETLIGQKTKKGYRETT